MTTDAHGRPATGKVPEDPEQCEPCPEERLARAALTRIVEPGDEKAGRWLRTYGAQEVVRALRDDSGAMPGADESRWAGLRSRAERARPEADLAAVEALGGRFVCPGDHEWPGQLDALGVTRPIGLWVRGAPSLRLWALRSVAIVGARACTEYGVHVAALLGAGLAERGWTVISGAAYGIDGAAHRGALAAGGATVGVLACGVDVAYPPGHAELIARIAEQGLVLAELPPKDHPTPSRFVLRNRVIAALTRGTVVVEAALRSGSLSTARHARRLGRFVMGVPGPVTSGLSAGVHELLREEGSLVTDAAEVIEMVGSIGELAPRRRGAAVPRDVLPGEAAMVLDALPARGAARSAQLAQAVGITADAALARLQELCALGFVERLGAGWQLNRSAASRSAAGHPIE
ncbi:DNA-processing protein DprA [Streptomyces sp. WMMB 322]|uniref:DNA-processing protein DprA n=1 Tax=Streptomyces sp. WMMB 322 TaxID=1286821 RepID=UPI000823BB3B|nr:DNA-processing protein DprA [Streptomyces sp. WMMB 322]SCK33747.1 DNA processing protein [Streptomyces sp. WMMB 322]